MPGVRAGVHLCVCVRLFACAFGCVQVCVRARAQVQTGSVVKIIGPPGGPGGPAGPLRASQVRPCPGPGPTSLSHPAVTGQERQLGATAPGSAAAGSAAAAQPRQQDAVRLSTQDTGTPSLSHWH